MQATEHTNRPRFQLPRLVGQLVSATVALLPGALAAGRYLAAPEPYVVGHSLQQVQHALDVQLKGVSAQKVVVSRATERQLSNPQGQRRLSC